MVSGFFILKHSILLRQKIFACVVSTEQDLQDRRKLCGTTYLSQHEVSATRSRGTTAIPCTTEEHLPVFGVASLEELGVAFSERMWHLEEKGEEAMHALLPLLLSLSQGRQFASYSRNERNIKKEFNEAGIQQWGKKASTNTRKKATARNGDNQV